MLKNLKKFQGILGDFRDCKVFQEILREFKGFSAILREFKEFKELKIGEMLRDLKGFEEILGDIGDI